MDTIGILSKKFTQIQEKYGNNYPILFYEPNIESNKNLKDLLSRNNTMNLFSELEDGFKFAKSLGISFILVVPSDYNESNLNSYLQELEHTYQRRMLDFEEKIFLRDLFNRDQEIKSFKVYVNCTLLDCFTESPIKDDEEEAMALCDIKEIAKQFRQEFIVIWYDHDINQEKRAKLEEEIDIRIEEKNIYTKLEDLLNRIESYIGTPYHLIMCGSEKAEKFLNEIDNKQNDLLGLYIYCKKQKQIVHEKVEIRSSLTDLIPRIKEGIRTKSKLNCGFPAFATNFDTSDRTVMNKLHYYLIGLRNFFNRKQAKEDFIKLARKIYQDQEKELVKFEERYNEYNREEIFRWYTKQSPIYKLINNCLRISSSDSILYCRLILRDLERAIQEQYQEKSRDFSGVVYRGAYISAEEWEKLERNIGEEIEMYGFLSTTVSPKTAVNFLRADLENKILIKIIIPPLPEDDEQGFADISKFSDFQNEKEILFNVRSKFRILEAAVSKIDNRGAKCRQLILLYGVQSLRKYMAKTKPSIEVKLELPHEIKCHSCESQEKLFGYKRPEEPIIINCLQCLVKGSMPKDTPLIPLNGEKDKKISKVLQGKIFASSHQKVAFSNSGYKCYFCEAKEKTDFYKWISCDGARTLIECSKCLKSNKIAKDNRILLIESRPYAMWQESQEEWETIRNDYQGDLLQMMELGNQAQVFIQTEDHKECFNFTKRILEKIVKRRRREMFRVTAFETLGEVFCRLGEYQQALNCWKNCQGLLRLSGKEKSLLGVVIHHRLGVAHHNLVKHKEALEYHNQALNIGRSLFQEKHLVIAFVYHSIASVYVSLNELKNALYFFIKSLDIQKSILGARHPLIAEGYSSLGLLYQDLGRNQEALEYLTLTLEIRQSMLGEKHSQTARSYLNLGLLESDLGDHQKAIKLLKKALNIQKSVYQKEHPVIAASYSDLAHVYMVLGRHQEAMEYLNKALEIDTLFYGETHPRTVASLGCLGLIWQKLGDYQKALEYLMRSLDHIRSCFGEKHFDVAASYHGIASVYQSLGDSEKALGYYHKNLDLLNAIFEGPHFSKAASYKNIADIHENLGKFQKALEYHQNALEMHISLRGEKHSHVALSYNSIGLLYSKLGHHSKATEYINKVEDIGKSTSEELNLGTALSSHDLAVSYESQGDFPRAVKHYTKAIEIQESFHQGDNPKTAIFYNNLGSAYAKLGEFRKAKESLEKALNMRKAILPENHIDFGHGYNAFGLFYELSGKAQKARKYYSKAIVIFETAHGETHLLTAGSYDHIGLVTSTLGNRQEAIKYQEKSLQIKQIIYGKNNAIIANSYSNFALCYLNLGDSQEAINNLLKAVKVVESYGGKNHTDAHKFYNQLFAVYSRIGDYKKAYEYFEKASVAREAP